MLLLLLLLPCPFILGRLPDADKGTIGGTIQHIRDIFGRMGFSDREMVALIGAHAVGRCHTEASGELKQTGEVNMPYPTGDEHALPLPYSDLHGLIYIPVYGCILCC